MPEPAWIEELVATVDQTHGGEAAKTTRILIDATADMRLRSTHQPPNTSGAAFVSVIPGMLNDVELFALFSKGGRVAVQLKTLRRINPFRIAEQEEALRGCSAGSPDSSSTSPTTGYHACRSSPPTRRGRRSSDDALGRRTRAQEQRPELTAQTEPLNVSQVFGSPDVKPVRNDCCRSADEPWVHVSRLTCPCVSRWIRSSPTAAAASRRRRRPDPRSV